MSDSSTASALRYSYEVVSYTAVWKESRKVTYFPCSAVYRRDSTRKEIQHRRSTKACKLRQLRTKSTTAPM